MSHSQQSLRYSYEEHITVKLNDRVIMDSRTTETSEISLSLEGLIEQLGITREEFYSNSREYRKEYANERRRKRE